MTAPINVLCDSPIEGLVLRMIQLDSCGAPVSGGYVIVMDGFVQVQDAPQYDTGDRKISRLANGRLCQNRKLPDEFTNDELTIDFCVWNPGVVVIALAGRLLTGSFSPTGSGFALGTWADITSAHWSLEVWQAPPEDCASEADQVWPYHAWPHLTDGKRGQMTINTDPTVLQIIANTVDGSPLWTAGSPWLGGVAIVAGDHYLRNLDNTEPPPSACIIAAYTAP